MPDSGSYPMPGPVWVWSVPFTPVTFDQTIELIDQFIARRRPSIIITANLHYVMMSAKDSRLRAFNDNAALIVADGMPIVWASRWRSRGLPQRVAGADLVPALCELAARRGYGVYFFGSAAGVAEEAAGCLRQRFPELHVVGIASPPFRALTHEEQLAQLDHIRRAGPDVLFVAMGQPKGELWIQENFGRLDVPAIIQVGASLDFAAGRIRRAPRWMQRVGLEWVFRLFREPGRLTGRYARNAWFAVRMIARDIFTRRANRR